MGAPPSVGKEAVDRLHQPFRRETPGLSWGLSLAGSLPLDAPFLCLSCHSQACCQLLCQGRIPPPQWPQDLSGHSQRIGGGAAAQSTALARRGP